MVTNPRSRLDPGAPVQDPALMAWARRNNGKLRPSDVTEPIMQRLMQMSPDPPAGLNELPARFGAPAWGLGDEGANLQGGAGADTLMGGTRSRYTLTARDVEAINTTSARLGIKPEDLTAVIHYETIGTMNPTIKGGKGGNYQGLIQFGPTERKAYGYNPAASFAEQVEGPVYRYLKDRGLQPGDDVGRIYRTINGGNRNAKLTKNDGNGTIAQHIARIKQDSLPAAQATLKAVPAGPNMEAIMDVAGRNTAPSSVPDQATAAMGFAPYLGLPPAQTAIADMLGAPPQAPLPAMPPTWASGSFPEAGGQGQDTMAGGTSPPMPRLRDQSVLDQQRADMLDEMLFGAGPHRGEYARGRPEGRFMGGGAPDASAVPMPTLSPLNPAVGGPADRRPQPPMPTMRPEGRWMGGGAPDAATVPNPPPRGTPYAPGFPDLYGEQPAPLAGGMSAEIGNAPVTPPRATRETWNSMGLGSRGNAETQMSLDRDWSQPLTSAPPTPPNPYDDWTRQYDTPGPITMANERMGVFEGTPDPSTIAPPPNTPEVGNVNYPGPLPTQRLPQTQAAASEPGMGLGPYGMSPTPPETGPFFDNANPGQTFTPPAPAGTSFNIPPSPFEGSTGEFFTPAPPMPMPQPSMMADRFSDAFSPGGGGQIMDLQSAFDRRNAPPTMNAQGGINSVFGAPPAQATVPNLAIPFAEVPRPNFDFAGPAPAAAANLTSPLPMPTISQQDFDARFAGGTVAPTAPTPGVTPGVVSGTMPEPGAMDSPPSPMAAAPAPLPTPAPAPTQTAAAPKGGGAGGFIGRALGGLLGGPLGAMGGGLLGGGGGGGGFGFSQPATFAWSGGGSAPYGNKGGSTTYQKGTTNALGGTNALSWQGSKGQTVTVVQDPWTGTYMTAF